MKISDISGIRDENGKIPFGLWLKTTLDLGLGWQTELDSQESISERLGNVLGNEFSLLRGVRLPGLDTAIPMVLVGPPGVFVIHASSVKGTFRARGDVWLIMDASGNMKTAHPNLPTRTRLYADAVRKYLLKNNVQLADIEAVLVFSRTDAFVENIKAPIRVVMSDGIENYSSSLMLQHKILAPEEITQIIRLLSISAKKSSGSILPVNEEITPQEVVMPSNFETGAPASAPQETAIRTMFTEAAEEPYVSVFSPSSASSALPSSKLGSMLARLRLSKPQFFILLFGALIDIITICLLVVVLFFLLQ